MAKVAAHDYTKKSEYTEALIESLWTRIEHNESGGVPYVFYDYEVKPLLEKISELEMKLTYLQRPVGS